MRRIIALFILPVLLFTNYNFVEARTSEKAVNWSASQFISEMNIGWNLGDSLESYYKESGYDSNVNIETRWGNPRVTKELIDYVSSLGFNTIRIPVSWYYNSGRDENGHLIIGNQWMQRVHEVVDYAIENDMYVIMNTMSDSKKIFYCGVESTEEWAHVQQDATDIWSQIAESFKEYDGHLLFEAYNELDNKVTGFTYSDLSAAQMNTLNQLFVSNVRKTGANNLNRVLIVPTLFDSRRTNITDAFVLPTDISADKLVVTVHNYDSEIDQDIEWAFQSIELFSNRVGVPVLIGEFGIKDNSKVAEWRAKADGNYVARAAKHGIKCCIWDDGYHYKIIDRYDFSKTNMDIVNALFEGVNGVMYETDPSKKVELNSMSYFYFGGMELKTGVVSPVDYKKKYWASLTTKTKDNSLLPIGEGDKIFVSMTTKNAAVNFWIFGITFFDKNQIPISYTVGKNISHKSLVESIPEGTAYYAVNTYDPYTNHKLPQIEQYFMQGDLKMTITFLNSQDNNQLYKR